MSGISSNNPLPPSPYISSSSGIPGEEIPKMVPVSEAFDLERPLPPIPQFTPQATSTSRSQGLRPPAGPPPGQQLKGAEQRVYQNMYDGPTVPGAKPPAGPPPLPRPPAGPPPPGLDIHGNKIPELSRTPSGIAPNKSPQQSSATKFPPDYDDPLPDHDGPLDAPENIVKDRAKALAQPILKPTPPPGKPPEFAYERNLNKQSSSDMEIQRRQSDVRPLNAQVQGQPDTIRRVPSERFEQLKAESQERQNAILQAARDSSQSVDFSRNDFEDEGPSRIHIVRANAHSLSTAAKERDSTLHGEFAGQALDQLADRTVDRLSVAQEKEGISDKTKKDRTWLGGLASVIGTPFALASAVISCIVSFLAVTVLAPVVSALSFIGRAITGNFKNIWNKSVADGRNVGLIVVMNSASFGKNCLDLWWKGEAKGKFTFDATARGAYSNLRKTYEEDTALGIRKLANIGGEVFGHMANILVCITIVLGLFAAIKSGVSSSPGSYPQPTNDFGPPMFDFPTPNNNGSQSVKIEM